MNNAISTSDFELALKSIDKHTYINVLKQLYIARFVDYKMSKLVKQNKGTTFYMSANGHEMVGIVAALTLKSKKDWAFPYYRDRAFVMTLGSSLIDIFGSFLARDVKNHSGGRMMPEHFSHKELKIPCQSSCVGSQYLQAVGIAKGIKEDEVVYVSGGDGSTSQGDFHEALNFSALHKLPIIFVVQDNNWAISVPKSEQTAGGSIAKIAKGYANLSVHEVDGTNYFELKKAFEQAVDKARGGQGPSLIVADVPRLGAHSNSDDPTKYKDKTTIVEEQKRDPVVKFEKYLLENNIINQDDVDLLQKEIFKKVEDASIQAEKIQFPSKHSAHEKVFKDFDVQSTLNPSDETIVMMDGLNKALIEEMKRDEGIVVFGEDVAKGKGGVFGITRNLSDMFGEERCFNTPLAESTIVGMAVGLSQDGFHKPVVEIQFSDYAFSGINQLLNELASVYYRSNGQWNCPVVVRMTHGGYIQGGPYHSQSIETHLCHTPGLKVVVPSNASDAKRLLKTAIRDPNPVVFLEHKALYRQRYFAARNEPSDDDLLEFGKANIVKEGSDVTVICYGMMVLMANDVATKLEDENISVEVIDLRTLVPLDRQTILESVKKTSKVIILHEAQKFCGFGAELTSIISEEAFDYLDAPIKRIAALNSPVPYCKDLEDAFFPQKEDLENEIKKLVNY